MKYHISPHTGMPAICRAKKGNCPYGGSEGHYNTYSEAMIASQENLEGIYNIISPIRGVNIGKKEKETISKYVEKINKYEEIESRLPKDKKERDKAIRHTEDEELIMLVIEGKIAIEDDWRTIGLALQNPNLPRRFIDKVVYDDKEKFNLELKRRLMLNHSLTHQDLEHIINNISDSTTISLALKNPSLDRDYMRNLLKDETKDLNEMPWLAVVKNESGEDIFLEFMIKEYPNVSLENNKALRRLTYNYL